MKRVFWRLMPFLLSAYLIACTDRVNVGFASPRMNKALGFSPSIHGLGVGIFLIGYVILEVPGNPGPRCPFRPPPSLPAAGLSKSLT